MNFQGITIICLILIFSCKKEKKNSENVSGTGPKVSDISFKIGLEEYKGQARIINRTWFHLSLDKDKLIDGALIPYETFSMFIIRKSMMKQRLYKYNSNVTLHPDIANTSASFNTMQGEGDVICEFFNVLESDSVNNFVIITKEVDNYSEVWGEFRVSLIKEETCGSAVYPDTLRIKEGKFHIFLN